MEEIKSIEEFWVAFDTLQWIMMEKKKSAIIEYMAESKLIVNGLSDGWFGLYARIKNIKKMWASQFNDIETAIITELSQYLETGLGKRKAK